MPQRRSKGKKKSSTSRRRRSRRRRSGFWSIHLTGLLLFLWLITAPPLLLWLDRRVSGSAESTSLRSLLTEGGMLPNWAMLVIVAGAVAIIGFQLLVHLAGKFDRYTVLAGSKMAMWSILANAIGGIIASFIVFWVTDTVL